MNEQEEEWIPTQEGADEFQKGYQAGRRTSFFVTVIERIGFNPDDGTPPKNEWQRGFLAGWRDRTREK